MTFSAIIIHRSAIKIRYLFFLAPLNEQCMKRRKTSLHSTWKSSLTFLSFSCAKNCERNGEMSFSVLRNHPYDKGGRRRNRSENDDKKPFYLKERESRLRIAQFGSSWPISMWRTRWYLIFQGIHRPFRMVFHHSTYKY